MFLATAVVQAQLVVGRRTQHVALVVAQGHMIGVLTVMQGMGNVRAIRITLLERHRHFRSADQWQVQAVRVPGIGAGQT
ncbi:hypothetical protein D3C71_1913750 [compost metagenome]